MFDKLLEKIKRVDEIESKLLSIFEGKSWEHIAKALYQILDDIDTADDMCKENFEAFRSTVMKLQAKKNQLLFSPNRYSLKKVSEWKEPSQEQLDKISQEMFDKDYDELPVIMQITVKDKTVTKSKVDVDECVCHIYGLNDAELLEFYGSMGDDWNAFNEPYGSDKVEVEEEIEKRGLDVRENGEKFSHVGPISNSIREFFDHKSCGKDEEYLTNFAISRFGLSKLSDVLCNEAKVNESKVWIVYYNDLSTDPPTEVEMKKQFEVETEQEALAQAEELLNREAPGGEWEVIRAEAHTLYLDLTPRQKQRLITRESLDENLTDHARRELELAGMFDKEVEGSEAAGSWNILCAEAVIELMEVFAEQGHSGFSASMTQDLFSRLARYEKLTELTDNLDEWQLVVDDDPAAPGKSLYQSRRSPSAFSNDEGKTYWDIDEDWNKHEDEDGFVGYGGLPEDEWKNRPMHQSKHTEKKE